MEMTKEPRAFSNGVQFAWDSTSIKLAEECLYKYSLKMIHGWESPTLSVHLRFGQHYATALEHYYKHVALGASSDEALISVVQEAMEATWERVYDEASTGEGILGGEVERVLISEGPWDSQHNTKTRENLIRTIVWYVDQFKDEAIKVLKNAEGKPLVEHSFTLPVDDGIIFAGHLDRMVEYAHDPMVMDQKTTGSTISSRYFEGFSPDTQMSMYTFAGKAIFGIPVKGVIIDAAQIAVGFTRFERGFTFRTDAQLNEWYDDTMYHIERARTATKDNYFPQNRTACGNYGGCPFRAACSRSPHVREQFLKADFVKGQRWDPLKSR
jgi:hypothetical protein